MPELPIGDLEVRQAIYARFAEGGVPVASDLANDLRLSIHEVRASCERLAAAHVVVLDQQTRDVWMAMPFSAIPTAFLVEGTDRSWYANCAWDAFGISAALATDVVITTACLDCWTPLTYRVEGLQLADQTGVVHFAVPAARWWDDIGFT